ncbi:OsmC family protein [Paenibacillus sp. FSL K6-2862]|uniref:OsmC family protein n=1 Tax=Paenibacillus sp. FSL K6-2862 TaxID=2921484 RepID=UPI0030FB01A8
MKLNAIWYNGSKGDGRLKANHLKTNIAIPEALGGSGTGADPKALLVSSAAACYLMTLVYMLETIKVPIAGFTMDSESTDLTREGMSITHYPKVYLSNEATDEQIELVRKAFVDADKKCEVGNLLKKSNVKIEIEGYVSIIPEEDLISEYVENYGLDW